MLKILLERREYLKATHLSLQTCSLVMRSDRNSECVSLIFYFRYSSIVKGPITLQDSRGQNLAAGTRSRE